MTDKNKSIIYLLINKKTYQQVGFVSVKRDYGNVILENDRFVLTKKDSLVEDEDEDESEE